MAPHMARYIKSTSMVVGGLCCFASSLAVLLFLFLYLAEGAGLQVFGFFGVSSITILTGLAHVVGFVTAACLLFLLGAALCAYGLVPAPESQCNRAARQMKPESPLIDSEPTTDALRCVRCRITLADPVHICPECGWTQP